MNHKDAIIYQLEQLIKKYFRIRMLRGLLISLSVLGLAFLALSVMNFYTIFPQWFRMTLFYSFLFFSSVLLTYFVILPALHYHDIGKRLSLEDAARMVGIKFGSQSYDYLLSYLELSRDNAWLGSSELRMAGISDKKNFLVRIPITSAIEWSSLLPYVKKYSPLLLLPIAIWLLWPHAIRTGSKRWIYYQMPTSELFPFRLIPTPQSLLAIASTQHSIVVRASGNSIPSELVISINGNEFKMIKENENTFYYIIPNIDNNLSFTLRAGPYQSQTYTVEVVKKPFWEYYLAELTYPSYLSKEKEILNQLGDLMVPQGTRIRWQIKPRYSHIAGMLLNDSLIPLTDNSLNTTSFTCMKNSSFTLFYRPNHPSFNQTDSFRYSIQVIPDKYPEINASFSMPDSSLPTRINIDGSIKDDYGFSGFTLRANILSADSSGKTIRHTTLIPLPFEKNNTFQHFNLEFDFSSILVQPGSQMEYVLEITDNDGVNGPKTSRSSIQTIKKPQLAELKEAQNSTQQHIKSELEKSLQQSKELQKNIQDLLKKMQSKKNPEYDDVKKLQEMQKIHQELLSNIEKLKELQQKNTQLQNEISPQENQIIEKYAQLQKLFDEMLSPELKKMMEELQKLQQQFLQKNELMQKLEEMKMNTRELEKELDRNLELFKQLEWQQKMWENIDKLEELKNQEAQLKEKTEQTHKNDKQSLQELSREQENIQKEWEKLKESIQDAEKKNSELLEPNTTPDLKEDMKKIDQSIQESKESLEKNRRQNAGKAQENAKNQMQEMLDKMNQSMQALDAEQQEENIHTLREILDNLLFVSFEQEKLLAQVPKTKTESPAFTQIMRTQKQLHDDIKTIEDSLTALARRNPQISNLVNKELTNIHYQMEKSRKGLVERNTSEAAIRMQGTLASINNLALLLHESMEQMTQQKQNQMQSNCSGGSCKKPKGGNGKSQANSNSTQLPNLRKLQEQLNRKIEELKKQLENGSKPNGEKPGEKPGKNPGNSGKPGILDVPGNSFEFSKMAAEQEMIRRQLMQLLDKFKNKGQNPGGNIADLMEQTERELLHKQINPETIRRQQEILTRLLESEKAERERELDDKRESREGKDLKNETLPSFLPYKRIMENEKMNYFLLPPDFTPYYKQKTSDYLNGIKP